METKVDNTAIESLIGEYGWLFVTGIIALLFQSTIQEAVSGLMVFLGNDYHEDDVVEVDGSLVSLESVCGRLYSLFIMW